MPFACIFVPDFPVEAILRAEPQLRGQALAVLEGRPPLEKVLGVNERARQLGIEPGMTKIQVEPCTQLTLRARSPLQEAAAHAALLDCAQSFSPRIEDTAPDTVLLDLAGLESLFGPPARIARDLARRASDLGLEAHVAAAANPDAACLAARGFSDVTVIPEGQEAERLGSLPLDVLFPELAVSSPAPETKAPQERRLASALPKAGALRNLQKAEAQDAARQLETFDLWGVRNLRALAALPEIALSQRLGQTGVRLQQLARGAVQRTLVPVEIPLIFEEAVELEHPLVLLEPLAFLLSHMLEQLCARLASRALAAQELRLRFELDSGFYFSEDISTVEDIPESEPATNHVGTGAPACPADPQGRQLTAKSASPHNSRHFTRTLRLPIPMLDAKTFLKLLQLDLKAHPPGAPILKIHLAAEPARPRAAQGGLFQPPTPEPEKLELTLARIAGMVGAEKVGATELLDTHHPEGFRMQHFVPPASENKQKKQKSLQQKTSCHPEHSEGPAFPEQRQESLLRAGRESSAEAPITALRVFRPPARATVTMRDGKPAHIVCPRRKDIQGDILWMAGPWRSSGDWWEQDGWSRDEWDIAIQLPVASGQLSVASCQWPAGSDSPDQRHQQRTMHPPQTVLVLYRLVHDLLSGRWFVEGTYD
jgi:protein ImuB